MLESKRRDAFCLCVFQSFRVLFMLSSGLIEVVWKKGER